MITKEEEHYLNELQKGGVREEIIKQLREAFEQGFSKTQTEQESEISLEEKLERARYSCKRGKKKEEDNSFPHKDMDNNKNVTARLIPDDLER